MAKNMQKEETQKLIKIKADAMWAFTDKPNEMSGKYQIDLCNISKAAKNAIEDMNCEVKLDPEKADKGLFVTCKSARPITVLFPDGEKVDRPIGNGSKVVAVLGSYDWTFKNKKGTSLSIKKLIVTDLVEYVGADDGEVEDIDDCGVDEDEEF
jgi:hypothetical protein